MDPKDLARQASQAKIAQAAKKPREYSLWDTTKASLSSTLKSVPEIFGSAANTLKDTYRLGGNSIQGIVQGIGNNAQSAINLENTVGKFRNNKPAQFITNYGGNLMNTSVNSTGNIIGGFEQAGRALGDASKFNFGGASARMLNASGNLVKGGAGFLAPINPFFTGFNTVASNPYTTQTIYDPKLGQTQIQTNNELGRLSAGAMRMMGGSPTVAQNVKRKEDWKLNIGGEQIGIDPYMDAGSLVGFALNPANKAISDKMKLVTDKRIASLANNTTNWLAKNVIKLTNTAVRGVMENLAQSFSDIDKVSDEELGRYFAQQAGFGAVAEVLGGGAVAGLGKVGRTFKNPADNLLAPLGKQLRSLFTKGTKTASEIKKGNSTGYNSSIDVAVADVVRTEYQSLSELNNILRTGGRGVQAIYGYEAEKLADSILSKAVDLMDAKTFRRLVKDNRSNIANALNVAPYLFEESKNFKGYKPPKGTTMYGTLAGTATGIEQDEEGNYQYNAEKGMRGALWGTAVMGGIQNPRVKQSLGKMLTKAGQSLDEVKFQKLQDKFESEKLMGKPLQGTKQLMSDIQSAKNTPDALDGKKQLETLIAGPTRLLQMGYTKAQVDRMNPQMVKKILDENITPKALKEIWEKQGQVKLPEIQARAEVATAQRVGLSDDTLRSVATLKMYAKNKDFTSGNLVTTTGDERLTPKMRQTVERVVQNVREAIDPNMSDEDALDYALNLPTKYDTKIVRPEELKLSEEIDKQLRRVFQEDKKFLDKNVGVLQTEKQFQETFQDADKSLFRKYKAKLPAEMEQKIAQSRAELMAGIDEVGMNKDVKDEFRQWVNNRQAGKIDEYMAQRDYSQWDNQGIDAFFKVQAGDPEFKPLREFFDNQFAKAKASGIDMEYQSDYLPQLWQLDNPEAADKLRRALGLKGGFTIEKVIEDYKKGIELGFAPKFNKISDLTAWYAGRVNKNIADLQYFKGLEKDGMLAPAHAAPKSWVAINPDNFPKVKMIDGTETFYKAPPELAKMINNYLATPNGTLSNVANVFSNIKNVAMSAGIPQTAINMHGINIAQRHIQASNNPLKATVEGLSYMFRPSMAKKYFESNVNEMRDAVAHGLTIGTLVKEADAVKGGKGKLGDWWNMYSNWNQKTFEKQLFDEMIPALKFKQYQENLKGLLKDMPATEAKRKAADIANSIYGGDNWEQLGKDRNWQAFLRTAFLAPDWMKTQFKIGKGIYNGFADFKNPEFKTYRNIVRNMAGMYVLANGINYLSSGKFMFQNGAGKDFQISAGYTEDGEERSLPIFSTSADYVRLPVDLVKSIASGDTDKIWRMIRNRLSTPAGLGVTLLSGVDYRGRKIVSSEDEGFDKTLKQGAEILKTVSPPQVRAIGDWMQGRTGPEQTLAQMFELPVRYYGGAESKTKQFVKDTAMSSGLKGKDVYDYVNNPQAKSAFSDNQKQIIKDQGVSALDQILGVRKANASDKEIKDSIRDTGTGQLVSNKFIYDDEGTVRTLDIGKVSSMPENNQVDKIKKTKARYQLAKKLLESDVEADKVQNVLDQLNIDPENATYYLYASSDRDIKDAYIQDRLTEYAAKRDRAGFLTFLADGRKDVAGSQLVTNGMVDDLYDQGLITEQEKKILKTYTFAKENGRIKITGRATKATFKAPKGRKMSVKPYSAPKSSIGRKVLKSRTLKRTYKR